MLVAKTKVVRMLVKTKQNASCKTKVVRMLVVKTTVARMLVVKQRFQREVHDNYSHDCIRW